MVETGFFIDEGGNDFWGVFPIGDEYAGHGYPSPTGQFEKPLILASDRDFGLYIFDYVVRLQQIRRTASRCYEPVPGNGGRFPFLCAIYLISFRWRCQHGVCQC